jgi:Tfp pilus assembly protein PilV
MENLVVTMIEVLFAVACVVVIGAVAVALIQGAFDHTHRRIYDNKKKWDNERS